MLDALLTLQHSALREVLEELSVCLGDEVG